MKSLGVLLRVCRGEERAEGALRAAPVGRVYTGHGPALEEGAAATIEAYLAHRRRREEHRVTN